MKKIILFCFFIKNLIFAQDYKTLDPGITINSNSDTLLFLVAGIDISGTDVYVADKIDYKVKLFSNSGKIKKSFGARGDGPGEYKFGPSKLSVSSDRIAAVDHTSNRICIYNKTLKPLKNLPLHIAITDIGFDKSGNLIIAVPPVQHNAESIFIYDKNYTVLTSFPLQNLLNNPLYDLFFIVPSQDKKLIVMFRYRNLLQEYDYNGKLLREISLDNLPEIVPKKEIKSVEVFPFDVPAGDMFWDIDIDENGILFLLGGDYSEKPNSTIYKIDKNLKVESIYYLNNKTTEIACSENSMWIATRHGSAISEYKYE